MTMLAPKRPIETRNYVFDLSNELGEDTISVYQLAVTSGAVVVQSTQQCGERKVAALICGGMDGQTSTLELSLTTTLGQVFYRDYSLLTANASNATGSLPSSTTKGQIMEMALAQLGLSGPGYTTITSTTTKGQIVNMAFEEVGLAGYEFDATPAEQASALQRLDSLMRQWSGPGGNLNLGYNFPPAVGGSALSDTSGIPDIALDAAVCGLALSLAPAIGKTLGAETQLRIKGAFTALRVAYAVDLRELDALMAQWASPGFNLDMGYNFPTSFGGSALTDLSGIPDLAVDAVVLSLARALPVPDKELSPDFHARLARAMSALRTTFARIPHVRLPHSTIRGAGAKPWSTWWPFSGSMFDGDTFNQWCGATPPSVTGNELGTENGSPIGTENGEIIGV